MQGQIVARSRCFAEVLFRVVLMACLFTKTLSERRIGYRKRPSWDRFVSSVTAAFRRWADKSADHP
jgi:hypothetical protein